MSALVDQYKRAEYQYREEPIDVIANIDRSGENAIRFEGIHLILIRGTRVSMPLWIAEVLERKGYVTIPLEESNLLEELDAIKTQEQGTKLSMIDKNLYCRIRNELHMLKRSNNPTKMMKFETIIASATENYNTILNLRAKKVVAMFSYKKRDLIQVRALPVEEKWLLDRFTEIYNTWKGYIGQKIKMELLREVTNPEHQTTSHFKQQMVRVNPILNKDLRLDEDDEYRLIQDEKIELPLWIAEILENEGIITIPGRSTNTIGIVEDLKRYVQGRSQERLQFSSVYFRWIVKEIERLKLRSNPNRQDLIHLNALESYFEVILRRKAREVITLLEFDPVVEESNDYEFDNFDPSENHNQDDLENVFNQLQKITTIHNQDDDITIQDELSPEEIWLQNRLMNVVGEWRQMVSIDTYLN